MSCVCGEACNGSVLHGVTEIDIEMLAASREGRVVGSLEVDAYQGQDRSKKPLCLPKWQIEDEPKG